MDFSAPTPRRPLLLVLHEFTALGRLDFFSTAIAYLRGYGIRVYISIQSLSQLHDVYGPNQSITTNCGAQVAFAPNDVPTAELLSKMTGTTTVHYDRRSESGGVFAGHVNYSDTDSPRPLLTPDELRRLPPDVTLTLLANQPPIHGTYLPYFRHALHSSRAATPPPEPTERFPHDWSPWTDRIAPEFPDLGL
jgi:type IV secretion system protein VirD4